jgi:hypothetical protein
MRRSWTPRQALAYVQRPGQGERVERSIPNIANEYEDWSLRWAGQDLKDDDALVAIALVQDVSSLLFAPSPAMWRGWYQDSMGPWARDPPIEGTWAVWLAAIACHVLRGH